MDDLEFEKRILALIAEALPPNLKKIKITTDTRLQMDLGLDSIAMLALLFRFEQAFGADLAALGGGVNLGQMRTVGDALSFGRDLLKRARTAEIL